MRITRTLMQSKYALVGLMATLLSGTALAQEELNINPNLGYYYWDMVGIQGLETRTVTAADGTAVETNEQYEFNTTRLEYLYDFCGKVDSFIGFSVARQRQNLVGSISDVGRGKSKFGEIFFGHHFTSGDFSDFYVRAGQIRAEDDFVAYWGEEFETRSLLEIGFRSRVGTRRNLELVQKTRYDELYNLQMEVGFLYHSAGSFSFGFSYIIKGDVKEDNALNQRVNIEKQDEASFTLRINI